MDSREQSLRQIANRLIFEADQIRSSEEALTRRRQNFTEIYSKMDDGMSIEEKLKILNDGVKGTTAARDANPFYFVRFGKTFEVKLKNGAARLIGIMGDYAYFDRSKEALKHDYLKADPRVPKSVFELRGKELDNDEAVLGVDRKFGGVNWIWNSALRYDETWDCNSDMAYHIVRELFEVSAEKGRFDRELISCGVKGVVIKPQDNERWKIIRKTEDNGEEELSLIQLMHYIRD